MRGMDVASTGSDLSAVSKHLDMSFRAAPPAVSTCRSRVRCRHELATTDRPTPPVLSMQPATRQPDNSWAPERLDGGRSPAL